MLRYTMTRASTLSAVCLMASLAQGGVVGYQTDFFGSNNNIPRLKVSNLSDSASIVEFVLTLNRPEFKFDYVKQVDFTGSVGAVLLDPEELQGGHRSDKIQYGFDAFEPQASFTFKADVDPTDANARVDYRSIVFDLNDRDPSKRADVFVRFSDGNTLSGTLPTFDPSPDGASRFSQSIDAPITPTTPTTPTVIPLPPGAWSGLGLLSAAAAIGLIRRTWRRVH